MSDESFLKEDLVELRKDLGLTQQEMANSLDMALRSYQAIEAGESAYRYIHRLAVERVALMIAADKKDALLAPYSVRKDAIELVRVGQSTGYPEFCIDGSVAAESNENPFTDDRFRTYYTIIGELVLLTTALDHQLNHILIQILHLADSPMLEAVVATLDMNRKIEMLKARAKYISNSQWQKSLKTHLEKLENVAAWRNIACHTALIPDEKYGAVFAPASAAKLLRNLQLNENPTSKKIPIDDLLPSIKSAESALFEGQLIIQNFRQLNDERKNRQSDSVNPDPAGMKAGR